ncbi:MAG TPA: hypothetical protein PLJ60_11150 [Chryseolinea sp.]|nr:hypothetical protein [Chryseolinea sp.]HPM30879.1 hypothetical protein [Chryseolinea sp.]
MKKFIFLIIIIPLFISCDEQLANQEASFCQNTMTFKSINHLNSIADKISGMSDFELDNWEKENSFVSYRSVLREAEKEWITITTQKERSDFLKKYEDILTLTDSTLKPLIDIGLYQSIVNREGIYQTNGSLNKLIGDFIVSVKNDEYKKIENLKSIDINEQLPKTAGVKIIKYTGDDFNINSRTKSACSTFVQASYFDNHSQCKDDRRVYVLGKSYILFSTNFEGDWRQPRVDIEVYGTKRSGVFCNWSGYWTVLQYRNVSYSIMAWSVQNGIATPTLISKSIPDNFNENEYTVLKNDIAVGSSVLNQSISASAFITLHAEGTSRGVSGNWAVVDCR